MFKPKVQQMVTPIRLQSRIETKVNGAPEVTYVDKSAPLEFCNWKSKGGSESNKAGSLVIADTAEVTMWYRPDIQEGDRILLSDNDELKYEVINPPENIEMRNQLLIIKVSRVVNA